MMFSSVQIYELVYYLLEIVLLQFFLIIRKEWHKCRNPKITNATSRIAGNNINYKGSVQGLIILIFCFEKLYSKVITTYNKPSPIGNFYFPGSKVHQ